MSTNNTRVSLEPYSPPKTLLSWIQEHPWEYEFFGMPVEHNPDVGPMRVREYECACCASEDRLGHRKVCTGRENHAKCDNCRQKGHYCMMVCLLLPTGGLPAWLTSNRSDLISSPSDFFSWKFSTSMKLQIVDRPGMKSLWS